MFGVHAEGADVFAMQKVALVIARSTDIVCNTDLFAGLDRAKFGVFPSCNEGTHKFAQCECDTYTSPVSKIPASKT